MCWRRPTSLADAHSRCGCGRSGEYGRPRSLGRRAGGDPVPAISRPRSARPRVIDRLKYLRRIRTPARWRFEADRDSQAGGSSGLTRSPLRARRRRPTHGGFTGENDIFIGGCSSLQGNPLTWSSECGRCFRSREQSPPSMKMKVAYDSPSSFSRRSTRCRDVIEARLIVVVVIFLFLGSFVRWSSRSSPFRCR